MNNDISFRHFLFAGADAENFLQGQITKNVKNLPQESYAPCAICDLKGRVQFGLWIRKKSETEFNIVISADLAEDFIAHVKKYGAFSKATLVPDIDIFTAKIDDDANFSTDESQQIDSKSWQEFAIRQGQAWITKDTSHLFQPQELRLHQRGGVDYDKGCYIGQEIIARLWFKAQPKHWLHLIQGSGECPSPASELAKDVQVVNAVEIENGWLALVVAKPDALSSIAVEILALPAHLNGEIGRPK